MLQPYKCYALFYLQQKHFNPGIKPAVAAPKMFTIKSCFQNGLAYDALVQV